MNIQEKKIVLLQSSQLPPPTGFQSAMLALIGLLLTPVYWLLAACASVPGLGMRWKCTRLGLRLLFKHEGPLDLKTVFLLLFYPLDSVRYFEFDFVRQAMPARAPEKYLDVSSPRLIYILYLLQHKNLAAELINPDKADLAETKSFVHAAGLEPRCRLHDCLIAAAPFAPGTFDLITCVSVMEHIPEDRAAIAKIWELLKPGGRFILTTPCAAATFEQYIDRDEYGLIGANAEGRTFWQRFYDPRLLEERVYSITGRPIRTQIFGERAAGLFLKNSIRKRTDRFYPFWREPWMVGREYKYFNSIEELPGEGVIAMEFIKS
jgi:SAM-dependent methyltransferase